jgi:hypothetical protein
VNVTDWMISLKAQSLTFDVRTNAGQGCFREFVTGNHHAPMIALGAFRARREMSGTITALAGTLALPISTANAALQLISVLIPLPNLVSFILA